MKKLLLGMIIGAVITCGVFYFINKQNENEERENLKAFLASLKEAKSTQMSLDEALNDPKSALVVSTALIVITSYDGLYYYRDNDCSKLSKTEITNITNILNDEKKQVPADKLMIIIKKLPGVSFRNSIDLLDAITNAGIAPGHFAEADMTESEKNCIKNYKKN